MTVPFIAALTAALIVFGVANGIHMIRDDGTSHFFESEYKSNTDKSTSMFVRLIDFLGIHGQQVLRRLYGPVRLRMLDRRLKNAGNPEGLTLDLFIQRESGFILLSVIIFIFMVLLRQSIFGAVIAFIFSCWMYLWLIQSIRSRQKAINRELPDFLDVLAVTVRSGLPFRNSLERVCEHFEGPVADEMRKALQEMRLGVSRRAAFTAISERCRSENIDTFVTALLQSEELGTPIGDALQAIVKEIRRERAEQVRRAAAKAAPKVSLAASLTMLPGTMILMIGGMLYANRDILSNLFGGG